VEREDAAARRLFGVLPDDQGLTLVALRSEFEDGETPEARFARALDSFQPTWQHWGDDANPPMENLSASSVLARKRQFVGPVDALWEELTRIVEAATRRGLLTP
jgi:putative hydrolase of HD superfamily